LIVEDFMMDTAVSVLRAYSARAVDSRAGVDIPHSRTMNSDDAHIDTYEICQSFGD
jgi:hypothetical protein